MRQYEEMLQFILDNGTWVFNERTGKKCCTFPVRHMLFDLTKGFPAVSTKKLAWNAVKGELLGFLRGAQSAADFRALGCKIWDQNANDPGMPSAPNQWLSNPYRKGEDDLGRVYGAQWRGWNAYKVIELADSKLSEHLKANGWVENGVIDTPEDWGENGVLYSKKIDQIAEVINKLINNPSDRRILFHAWNPAELDEMALPPCHLYYQFIPNPVTKELSLHMTQRSMDAFLGAPFNIASCALLLEIIARLTGYTAKWLDITAVDAHIYSDHLDQVKIQLSRDSFELPTLSISSDLPTYEQLLEQSAGSLENSARLATDLLSMLRPEMFSLSGYQSHSALKAPMAV